jgi:hypothetical protein
MTTEQRLAAVAAGIAAVGAAVAVNLAVLGAISSAGNGYLLASFQELRF